MHVRWILRRPKPRQRTNVCGANDNVNDTATPSFPTSRSCQCKAPVPYERPCIEEQRWVAVRLLHSVRCRLLASSWLFVQAFAFQVPTAPDLLHSSLVPCATRAEPPLPGIGNATETAVPADLRMLFIIGAQKGGTTWLFNALTTHPAFVGASRAYRCGVARVCRLARIHFVAVFQQRSHLS